MIDYSVAIRTLGKTPDILRQELESLHNQTVPPKQIIIYIAKGYNRPDFTIGMEQYIEVNKGMVAQRALPYDEITTDLLLLLDDDVSFQSDAIERVLALMESTSADCIAFDTFRNHEMSVASKFRAAITGFVFPRFNKKWAFKIHWNDSFSYINHPGTGCYKSMSAAGPAAMWKKNSLLKLRFDDELWLDNLGFAYGDDALEFYKLYANGGKLMVTFDTGITNLDAKTASSTYHKSSDRFLIMAMANTIRWHRMHYQPTSSRAVAFCKLCAFSFKVMWQVWIIFLTSMVLLKFKSPVYFVQGMLKGIAYIKSPEYKKLHPYILSKDQLRIIMD